MAESGNLQCFPAQETMDLMRDAPLAEQARAQEGDIHADQACETDLKEEGKIVRQIVTLQVDDAESEGKDENAHWDCRRPHADRKHEQAHNDQRPDEHTSDYQSLMRISYAGCCLKKKKKK